MSTDETIRRYFTSIHTGGWESYVADDFIFVNSNLDKVERGKAAYVEAAGRFFRATTSVEIRKTITAGDDICVLARYELRSPKGKTGVSDVAEIMTVKDGKISSSAIFFDTKAFQEFMAQ